MVESINQERLDQINKATNEYWNRKRLEKIYNSPSVLLERMSRGELKGDKNL